LREIEIAEGGKFVWPAASASFFRRSETPGGVLLDSGVHALDLLRWWLGEPADFSYQDDALGGLEANAVLRATWPGGVRARVRLSRDWATENAYRFTFARGTVRLRVNDANRLELRMPDWPETMAVELRDENGAPAATHAQSFILQLRDVVHAVRDGRAPAVAGEEGAAALRWLEACYARRTPLQMPWLGPEERTP
jgi:predicted dehydrogenase